MSRLVRAGAMALACLLIAAGTAFAAFPADPPNDPDYASAEGGPADCLTKSADAEQHELYDFMPQCTKLATDPEGASGMSVNKAWRDFTAGSGATTIAYVEGGINWHAGDAAELATLLHEFERGAARTDAGADDADELGIAAAGFWFRDDGEEIAANAAGGRHGDRIDQGRGDGGIDRVAAVGQHLEAGRGGQGMGGGDHSVASVDRRAPATARHWLRQIGGGRKPEHVIPFDGERARTGAR